MAKRSRDAIDATNHGTTISSLEQSNTSSHLICPIKNYYSGNKTVALYYSDNNNNNNSNNNGNGSIIISPSPSPVKSGKRYRFTSCMKRVDTISKNLNLCDFTESDVQGVSPVTKSF
jgi:hypothetical protein